MKFIGSLVRDCVELSDADWTALGARIGDRVMVELGGDVFAATVAHIGGRYVVALPCQPSAHGSHARPRVRWPHTRAA